MKCKFCNNAAGFMKSYHQSCYDEANIILKKIENMANDTKKYDDVPASIKNDILKIVQSSQLYCNYLQNSILHKEDIRCNESIIYVENNVRITETKNRCRMVGTGYRYEKTPKWSNSSILLSENGRVIFTDKAIYLEIDDGTMRYSYNKIVNYAINNAFTKAYFDVNTTSPFPHRFEICSILKAEDGRVPQNIVLFIHALKLK